MIEHRMEGLVEVVEMDSLVIKAERVGELLGADAEISTEALQFKKKRTIKEQKSSKVHVCWSLDILVTIKSSDSEETVIEAEIFLLPEELPAFTGALYQHPVLIPTNFSQHVSMERGMYCVRLKSQEDPEDFAQRLSDTLRRLA